MQVQIMSSCVMVASALIFSLFVLTSVSAFTSERRLNIRGGGDRGGDGALHMMDECFGLVSFNGGGPSAAWIQYNAVIFMLDVSCLSLVQQGGGKQVGPTKV